MPWEEDLDRSCSMKSLQGYNQDVTQNGDGAFSHKCVHLSYSTALGNQGQFHLSNVKPKSRQSDFPSRTDSRDRLLAQLYFSLECDPGEGIVTHT